MTAVVTWKTILTFVLQPRRATHGLTTPRTTPISTMMTKPFEAGRLNPYQKRARPTATNVNVMTHRRVA